SEIGLEQAKEPAAAAVQNGLLSQTVRRQLAALPQKQRAAVILRYQEDLQPAEIAAMLKIPVNTVKSHLQRALETLRERLEPRQRVGV
ncbi:MAG: RNA polymerase sigma factor, partial [Acidobacteriaceae bacterium]|nr:RNA polymerase sigma factor [Acidobacteriaceae bacterium]